MRINTEKSIKLGERIYDHFGSWEAVRNAAAVNKDGTYVVPQFETDDKSNKASSIR